MTVCVLAVMLLAQGGWAQTLPQSPTDVLRAMTLLAGVIFTGQVTAIRRVEGVGGASGFVEIDFAVQDAVRGVSGGTYTVREWAGLWTANDTRYRIGQRFLMLLHAPGPGGLSSPVAGMDGAIPIRNASAGQDSGDTMDLGWLAARVVRPVVYRETASARPITVHGQAVGSGTGAEAAQGSTAPVSVPLASIPTKADYGRLIETLRTWENEDNGTH